MMNKHTPDTFKERLEKKGIEGRVPFSFHFTHGTDIVDFTENQLEMKTHKAKLNHNIPFYKPISRCE